MDGLNWEKKGKKENEKIKTKNKIEERKKKRTNWLATSKHF